VLSTEGRRLLDEKGSAHVFSFDGSLAEALIRTARLGRFAQRNARAVRPEKADADCTRVTHMGLHKHKRVAENSHFALSDLVLKRQSACRSVMAENVGSNRVMGNSVAAEAEVSTSTVHFYCTFRTEMSEWSGDGGPYLSEYEGDEDDVDEFRLAGRASYSSSIRTPLKMMRSHRLYLSYWIARGETAAYVPCCTRLTPTCSRQRYVGFCGRTSVPRETCSF
jgi:hypothetical protein